MSFVQSIIFGVVEGVTEFLPISSTGHLILVSKLLRVRETDFLKTFEIVIQLGAMLAVVGLYIKKIPQIISLVPKLVVAFIPTAIVGLALYPLIRQWLGNDRIVLWSLLWGGVAILVFEWWYKGRTVHEMRLGDVSYKQAMAVGVFQSIAVIPGVSRAAATIVGGMLVGISRPVIVEFSFLLALPTIAAAAGLDLLKTPLQFSGQERGLLCVGLLVSFIAALFVLKWFIRFISRHSFVPFGIYRIVVAILGFTIFLTVA